MLSVQFSSQRDVFIVHDANFGLNVKMKEVKDFSACACFCVS